MAASALTEAAMKWDCARVVNTCQEAQHRAWHSLSAERERTCSKDPSHSPFLAHPAHLPMRTPPKSSQFLILPQVPPPSKEPLGHQHQSPPTRGLILLGQKVSSERGPASSPPGGRCAAYPGNVPARWSRGLVSEQEEWWVQGLRLPAPPRSPPHSPDTVCGWC